MPLRPTTSPVPDRRTPPDEAAQARVRPVVDTADPCLAPPEDRNGEGDIPAAAPLDLEAARLEAEFRRLAEEWREATEFSSSSRLKENHPAYRQIIRMGRAVLPLIYQELKSGRGHWFAALEQITGENPVRAADAGYINRMRRAWIRYLEDHAIAGQAAAEPAQGSSKPHR